MTQEPSHIPIDTETFLDKLACGFGRVVLFLRENDAAPYRAAIADACLHHRAFDSQTESYRTEYLCDIMEASGEHERYAARIRQALATEGQAYCYDQLHGLALRLAQQGDEEARQAMYDRFARNAARHDTTGAEDIVTLDGLSGYLFVVEQFRLHPLPEEDHWEEAWLWEQLRERMGSSKAKWALDRASQDQPGLAAYLAGVKQKRTRWHDRRRRRPAIPIVSYDEITAAIADPTQTARWPKWRSWSRRLGEATLRQVAQDLLEETGRVPLLKRLHLFREKPFPLPIDRLLDLARARDAEIAEAARWALGSVTDPRVRALALELSEDGTAPVDTAHLLRNNFAPGDYVRVERLVISETSPDEYHQLGMVVRDLIKANPAPEAVPSLMTLYERGRCAMCRSSVVELLASLGPLPPWIVDEGRYDAEPLTRSAVLAGDRQNGP